MSGPPKKSLRPVPISRYHSIVHEIEIKMENGFNVVNEVISKTSSENEAIKAVVAKTDVPQGYGAMSYGLIYGILTSTDRETYQKYEKLYQQIHHIDTNVSLTPMNYIAMEAFWQVTDSCRNNFISLMTSLIRWKVSKIEIVIANMMKAFLEYGPLTPRYPLLCTMVKLIKPISDYLFQECRDSMFTTGCVLTVCTHYVVEIRQCHPDSREETKRTILEFLAMIVTKYFPNIQILAGRELIFMIHLLSGTPEFSQIWKNMVLNPSSIHPNAFGVHDIFRRPMERFCNVTPLPQNVVKKADFLTGVLPDQAKLQWKIIIQELQNSPEGNMRGLLVRHALYSPFDPTMDRNYLIDNRGKAIAQLLCSCKQREGEPVNYHEFQIAKLALIYEFLGYDMLAPNVIPPITCAVAWRALHCLISTNQIVANSVFDFLVHFVQNAYPALTPMFVSSFTKVVDGLQKGFGQSIRVSDILDSTKIDKPIRESMRELFPGLASYFVSSKQSPVDNSSKSSISTSEISVAQVLDQEPKKSEQKKPLKREPSSDGEVVKKKKVKKSRLSTDEHQTVPEVEPELKPVGWDASLGESVETHFVPNFPGDVKESLSALEQAVKDNDDKSAIDAVDETFAAIIRNTEIFEDEEEMRLVVSDCFLVIFKKFLLAKKYYYTKKEKNWNVSMIFNHPFYQIFKQYYTHDETPLVISIFQEMANKYPPVGYLLLFYICASKIQNEKSIPKEEYDSPYIEFCDGNDKEAQARMATDMEACALDDYQLFKYLLPKVFEFFPKHSTGSESLIKVICTHCFSDVVAELLTNVVCESIALFKRETFASIVTSSLEWELFQQMYFWELVKAEGVQYDWVSVVIPKINFEKHHEAAVNVLVYMRTFGDPNITLMRQLLSRPPGDRFTLNGLKMLIQEEKDCQKTAQYIISIIKKGVDEIAQESAKSKNNTGKKIPLRFVLSHLDNLRINCMAKPFGYTERMMKELVETFSEITANPECDEIRIEFAELFSAMELIGGSGRSLRKNRQRGVFENDEPKSSKRRRIASDSEEDD